MVALELGPADTKCGRSTMRLSFSLCLALTASLAAGLAAPLASARELTPAEKRVLPFASDLPQCNDPDVLSKISSRFADKESSFWNSALTLVDYQRVTDTGERPWGLDLIPRRFCSAVATTSDGRRHRVDYSLREDQGFLGFDWGVDFCVQGLDRNWAYNPGCRMARP
jgi:hypothetical protein